VGVSIPLLTDEHAWEGVWIAVSAFNEAATIRTLTEKVLVICPRVIVVDDASTDLTIEQLQGLGVTLLQHKKNEGKAACLKTAFDYASTQGARCVMTMDGDGQHDPADAPKLLAVWLSQPNHIVIGARLHDRSQFPKLRYYANRTACFWISWAAGHPIADSQSGFRVYPSEVVKMVREGRVKGQRFTFESEVLIEASNRGILTAAVAIPATYPLNARPSHFRPVVDIAKIVLMVAGKLICKGMFPMGLLRCLKPVHVLSEHDVPRSNHSCHKKHRSIL